MNFNESQPTTQTLPSSLDGGTTAATGFQSWNKTNPVSTSGSGQKSAKGLKQRKCKHCKNLFTPDRPLKVVCSPDCAVSLSEKKRTLKQAKERRETAKADRAKREKLKSRADWAREAQAEVNRYVRLRDMHLGCVSCDKPSSWDGQWHASHFRSVGAASAVRFNLWNIHKSCSICNNWKSGNLIEYEPRLREKIGLDKVDWLRTQNQKVNYSIEYLKRLKNVFARKSKRLERRMERHTGL